MCGYVIFLLDHANVGKCVNIIFKLFLSVFINEILDNKNLLSPYMPEILPLVQSFRFKNGYRFYSLLFMYHTSADWLLWFSV